MSDIDQIVGRETEIESLERFVAGVDAWPGALLIEGAAGIGKSTLLGSGGRRGEGALVRRPAVRTGRSGVEVLVRRPPGPARWGLRRDRCRASSAATTRPGDRLASRGAGRSARSGRRLGGVPHPPPRAITRRTDPARRRRRPVARSADRHRRRVRGPPSPTRADRHPARTPIGRRRIVASRPGSVARARTAASPHPRSAEPGRAPGDAANAVRPIVPTARPSTHLRGLRRQPPVRARDRDGARGRRSARSGDRPSDPERHPGAAAGADRVPRARHAHGARGRFGVLRADARADRGRDRDR